MNCRDFLTEFEERVRLSEAATLHLNDCPNCKKTSSEQTRVWQMIDVLPRVDAPVNFDFRVKARIANSKSADFQPRFFPALRYVMPLGVIVLLLGIIAFNTNYFSDNNTATQIAEIVPQTPIVQETLPNSSLTDNQFAAANVQSFTDEKSVANTSTATPRSTTKQKKTEYIAVKSPASKPGEKVENEGGSRDIAVRKPFIGLPAGIPPQSIEISPNINNLKNLTDEQMLSEIGIEIVLENGKRTVKSVKRNSLAERSDVKVGDVIEAIDGKKISGEPLSGRTIEVKTLTVLRGAKKIEIALPNQ